MSLIWNEIKKHHAHPLDYVLLTVITCMAFLVCEAIFRMLR
jgi:hypothetical protein